MQSLHKASAKRAAQLAPGAKYKLNLACGPNRKPGWINVDLVDGVDLQLDLRENFPFPNDSVEIVYSEHFFEHLNYPSFADTSGWLGLEAYGYESEVLRFLRESYRVLIPGGLFSVGVPDAEPWLIAYANRDDKAFAFARDMKWHREWCDTPMHQINYLFRQAHEHKYAYDWMTLSRIIESVGFVDVERREFDPSLDSESRKIGTLYVDARKPVPG